MVNIGPTELVITCFVGLLGIGFPVAILAVLYVFYQKLDRIEKLLSHHE